MKRWNSAEYLVVLLASIALLIQTGPPVNAIRAPRGVSALKLYLAVSFPSRTDGFVGALRNDNSKVLLVTTDGGRQWSSPAKTMPWPAGKGAPALPGILEFVDARHGWVLPPTYTGCPAGSACLAPNRLRPMFATRDGGRSWHRQLAPSGVHLSQVQFISPSDGWMLGYPCSNQPFACAINPEALETTDGGARWRLTAWSPAVFGWPVYQSPPAQSVWDASLHFRSHTLGWIATSYYGDNWSGKHCESNLLLTTDGGAHWSRVLHRRGVAWCGMIPAFANGSDGWVVATSGTSECSMGGCSNALFHTVNGGRTWATERGQTWKSGPFISGGFPDGIQAPDPRHVWIEFGAGAGPGGGGVATTSNGSRTWTRSLICYRDTDSSKVALTGPSSAWVAGDTQDCPPGRSHGPVVRTTNGGRTWQAVKP